MTELVLTDDALLRLARIPSIAATWAFGPLAAHIQTACSSCKKRVDVPASLITQTRERLRQDTRTQKKLLDRYQASTLRL